jgi:hypothetical protein
MITTLPAGLLALGREHFTDSGIIGRPSLAAAMKGKDAITNLV